MSSTNVIKHRFSDQPPLPHEVAVAELALQIFKDTATLYTKSVNGEIIELGKGALRLEDLEDLDLTNLKEGSFLVRQGDKFVASSTLGDVSSLSDLEINNPQAGEYLRYDPLFLSFKNFKPSYNLYQLLDVDILDPTDPANSTLMNDQTLYYHHASGKFKMRPRRKYITDLDDVIITGENVNQILQLDTDGFWKNMNLAIIRDLNPALGGDLDARGYQIHDSAYRVNTVTCNQPIVNINYTNGDYWIINGVPASVNEQCILTINFNTNLPECVAIMMLEVRQDTGNILIGGLQNIQYEDGKPIKLSGAGKVDLITITVKKVGTEYTSYVTASALNLATLGNGGTPAYRYDKNRYADVQVFDAPTLYDDYFDYVKLLLNFEAESSSGLLWYQDKSGYSQIVTTSTTQQATDIYTFGVQEYVAAFLSESNSISITANSTFTLASDFTLEFFIAHPDSVEYMTTGMNHVLFQNANNTLALRYIGNVGTSQDTYLELKIHDSFYRYYNAYAYFKDSYVHFAVVRSASNGIRLFVNGIRQAPTVATGVTNVLNTITITTASITGFKGLLNSVRITEAARYSNNFKVPDMRFGTVGGADGVMDAQVFDSYIFDQELEYAIFI